MSEFKEKIIEKIEQFRAKNMDDANFYLNIVQELDIILSSLKNKDLSDRESLEKVLKIIAENIKKISGGSIDLKGSPEDFDFLNKIKNSMFN